MGIDLVLIAIPLVWVSMGVFWSFILTLAAFFVG